MISALIFWLVIGGTLARIDARMHEERMPPRCYYYGKFCIRNCTGAQNCARNIMP
jgi:hypothetical protein